MKTFNDQGLDANILKAIDELGFVNPTPIQELTIPAILNSEEDIIGLAQTGTGKTAGFGLPILQKLSSDKKVVQAIILSPTRELCLQITKDLDAYSKYLSKVSILSVYGGARIDTQITALKKGVQIVVGTPGRTLDLIKRGALKIDHIQWLVLDEADEMLNMGFRDELDGILETTPSEKQTLLFSATMPNDVRRIAQNYMNNPTEISAGKKNTGADNVVHHYYVLRATDRYLALKRLADINPNIYGIVFCRTRHETKEVANKLIHDGYNADALHGDLSQAQREQVMGRFREKQLQLLVATDVAARGIDITDLTHVLNYNLPDDPEVYLHRSGRTGRAGKSGVSISLTHTREGRRIRDIEKMVGKKFEQKLIPTGKEICEKNLYNLMDKVEHIEVDEKQIAPFVDAILQKLEWLERDELIKRFISVEFNHFLEYYKDAKDINLNSDPSRDRDRRDSRDRKEPREWDRDRKDSRERKEPREWDKERNEPREKKEQKEWKKGPSGSKFSRFYINIGEKQNIKAQNLIGLVNENTRVRDIEIGKIEILRNFSFFEVDKSYEKLVLDSFKDAQFGNTELVVEISKPMESVQNNKDLRDNPWKKERSKKSAPSKRGERSSSSRKPTWSKNKGKPSGRKSRG
ncbi:MAG: DEAD/DEAH box helicase [Bacteroidales bacterium]|nr:DEAD/DEAH box helicase [Bacteroidales bacterium]MCF8454627.1 DEAD/DEAH box helicase [Bacteroidales bacterium]